MSDPTIPEMVRRLDEITRTIERVVNTMETSYVRRDVYDARHDAIRNEFNGKFTSIRNEFNGKVADLYADLKDIKDTRAGDQTFRRQIMAGAAVGIILILVNLAIATSNLVRIGG